MFLDLFIFLSKSIRRGRFLNATDKQGHSFKKNSQTFMCEALTSDCLPSAPSMAHNSQVFTFREREHKLGIIEFGLKKKKKSTH